MSHTMRTTTLAALLLGSFLAATSCRTVERRPLPPPGPPVPSAPEPANPPSPHPEQRAAPPEGATADPSFLAVVYRWANGRREPDGEATALLMNLLSTNRLAAWRVDKPPADLPPGIIEGAQAIAASAKGGDHPADVLIYGELTPGAANQLYLVAVDMKSGRQIDNFGNLLPAGDGLQKLTYRTLEDLLRSVYAYRHAAATAPPPPPAR